MLTYEMTVTICVILSLTAAVFSWVTMYTQNWRWYLPTVLFGVAGFALSIWGQFAF